MTRREIPLVLGTAGHIDHGKTALVRAMTGIDCDRLDEEKRRGITIELGFAPLELPDGRTISIVDVPGHERFIRQMVAGAAGIDAVLLVVAADEGVMPQTREHLEILDLLGIRKGLVALTKIDRVDRELLEMATEDVRNLLAGTFLEKAPLVPVSAQDGSGIKELLKEIQEMTLGLEPRSSEGPLFLPIDRAFPISGFGTVVTGTAYAGAVKIGDEVEILPSGNRVRVRSLEVHEQGVKEAFAGQRTAVNLSGVAFKDVHRGDVLCAPSLFKPTRCLDVSLKALKSNEEPLKHWQRVRLHIGTSDILARVSFFDPGEKVFPGATTLGQLALEEPLCAAFNQGFIIRAYSPLETIGGGRVLFPYAWKPRNRKRKSDYLLMLEELSNSKFPRDRLMSIMQTLEIISLEEASGMLQIPSSEIMKIAVEEAGTNSLYLLKPGPAWLVSRARMDREWEAFSKELALFHEREPHMRGLTMEEAISRLFAGEDTRVAKAALAVFNEKGLLAMSESRVGLAGFIPQDESRFEKEIKQILELCKRRGFEMPTLDEALAATGLSKENFSLLIKQMRENGKIHLLGGDLLLSEEVMSKGIDLLRKCSGDITLAAFRDLSGSSRKYALPFLEYMDAFGVTRRVGEKRVLRPTRV
jgi:selenocysteine-specific elongation factor